MEEFRRFVKSVAKLEMYLCSAALSRSSDQFRCPCTILTIRNSQTIDLCKTSDPIFVLDLAPRFANSITSVRWVKFVGRDQSLLSLVDTLRRLPRVARLTLNLAVLRSAFEVNSFPPDSDWFPYDQSSDPLPRIWRAFDLILSRLEEVEFKFIGSMAHICPLLPTYRGLRRLSLEGIGLIALEDPEILSIGRLLKVLPALESLRSFELICHESTPLDLSPLVPSDGSSPRYPPLETLSVCAVELHPSWLSFANLFSHSLLHLSFDSTDDEELHFETGGAPIFDFTSASFPHVTTLYISAIRAFTAPILLTATTKTFPLLNDLTLGMQFWDHRQAYEIGSPEDITLMNHANSLLPERRCIRFFDKYWSLSAEAVHEARKLGIKTSLVPSFPSEALLEDLEEEDEEEDEDEEASNNGEVRDDLPRAIGRAINFLVHAFEQAEITESSTEWKRLVNLLRDVELERVAMKC